MTALQMQTRLNDAYARALGIKAPNRAIYERLGTMLMALNHQRIEEGLEPLHLPNLWRTYNALCGRVAKIGDVVEYTIEEYTTQARNEIARKRVTARVIDVFENGDIRTDWDGVIARSEYTIIK